MRDFNSATEAIRRLIYNQRHLSVRVESRQTYLIDVLYVMNIQVLLR